MSRRRQPLHARRGEQDGANEREPAPRHLASVAFANASGRRSRSTQRRSVFGPTAITWRSSPNSASSWRHAPQDRKSTRLNSSHLVISYAVFCLKKKKKTTWIHC